MPDPKWKGSHIQTCPALRKSILDGIMCLPESCSKKQKLKKRSPKPMQDSMKKKPLVTHGSERRKDWMRITSRGEKACGFSAYSHPVVKCWFMGNYYMRTTGWKRMTESYWKTVPADRKEEEKEVKDSLRLYDEPVCKLQKLLRRNRRRALYLYEFAIVCLFFCFLFAETIAGSYLFLTAGLPLNAFPSRCYILTSGRTQHLWSFLSSLVPWTFGAVQTKPFPYST